MNEMLDSCVFETCQTKGFYDLSQLLPSVSTDIATSLKMLLKRTALEIVVRKPVVILRGEPFDESSNLFHEFTE
jgi:hypothetical protein